jgi:hypothetical protein
MLYRLYNETPVFQPETIIPMQSSIVIFTRIIHEGSSVVESVPHDFFIDTNSFVGIIV